MKPGVVSGRPVMVAMGVLAFTPEFEQKRQPVAQPVPQAVGQAAEG